MQGPRKIGVCKIPPHGLTFGQSPFSLKDCPYATASYDGEFGNCAVCGLRGCSHEDLVGEILSEEEWAALPDRVVVKTSHYSGIMDKRAIWHSNRK